ncbi:hypothetical protein GCM10028807_22160 [Spirosoma daeguense]
MPYYPYHKRLRWLGIALLVISIAQGIAIAQPRVSTNPVSNRGGSPSARQGAPTDEYTIENDQIRVGVSTAYGGSITYMAFRDSKGGKVSTANMVNNPDLGRQVQIAVYGGPRDYSKNGEPGWIGLGWNPIQAGDVYGNSSQVLSIQRQSNLIYVKTIPKQFAYNNEPGEGTIEHWLRLEGNVVKVHARVVLARTDKTQYAARQQEMPCVYLNSDYKTSWYYKGNSPFTNAPLDALKPTFPNTYTYGDAYPTEPWMASVNDNGYGVGLYVPNNYDWKWGYFGDEGNGSEFSTSSSYIAAVNFVLLDHNIVHEWDYELVLGHYNEIRSYVYNQKRPFAGPNYRFKSTRSGWYYYTAKDSGWPIVDKLHILLDDPENDHIKSPYVFWKGRNTPKMYIRGAFKSQSDKFRLSWRRVEDKVLSRDPNRYTEFSVINDGQMRTYEVDLSRNIDWLDHDIGQIELRTVSTASKPGDYMELEWIAQSPNGPSDDVVTTPVDPDPGIVCTPGCIPIVVKKTRYIMANRKR